MAIKGHVDTIEYIARQLTNIDMVDLTPSESSILKYLERLGHVQVVGDVYKLPRHAPNARRKDGNTAPKKRKNWLKQPVTTQDLMRM